MGQPEPGNLTDDRTRFLAHFERLLAPGRVPLFGTITHSLLGYHNGEPSGGYVDGADAAMALRWRILDRGGVLRSLVKRVENDINEQLTSLTHPTRVIADDGTGTPSDHARRVWLQLMASALTATDKGRGAPGDPPTADADAQLAAMPVYLSPEELERIAQALPPTMLPPPGVHGPPRRHRPLPPYLPGLSINDDCKYGTSALQRGQWRGSLVADVGDADAPVARFVPPSECGFQDIGLEEARAALAGKHVLMIGDSVMRYQARHLIYALHFGEWPMRFRGSKGECGCLSRRKEAGCLKPMRVVLTHSTAHTAACWCTPPNDWQRRALAAVVPDMWASLCSERGWGRAV